MIEKTKLTNPILSSEQENAERARRVLVALTPAQFDSLHKRGRKEIAEIALSLYQQSERASGPQQVELSNLSYLYMDFHEHVLGTYEGLGELKNWRDYIRRKSS